MRTPARRAGSRLRRHLRLAAAVNTNALRGVHLVEPLYSAHADMQALGRALRYYGHKMLTRQDWNVRVWRYFAVPPTKFDKNSLEHIWGPSAKPARYA